MKLYYLRPEEHAWPVWVSDKDVEDANFWSWLHNEAERFPNMNFFFVVETTDIW